MKIAVVSLGCPKNQTDADVFCRALLEEGHQTVADITQADAVIINTCGFIESAKEEAIENILAACSIKKQKPELKIMVTGCLAERYKSEIATEIPEVDAVVGIGSNKAIPEILLRIVGQKLEDITESYGAKTSLPLGGARIISTPRHYAWLKISEGCSNNCSYCAIPSIRGGLRSRPMGDCIAEARWLAEQGVKELVLVAQDVTAYGDDFGESQIVPLLEELQKIDGLHWIRLLYAYPERINKELLQAMKRNSKVVHYLDIPIQHINDEILKSMRRKGDSVVVKNAVALARKVLPDITLRTTLIAGYPGETKAQFDEMLDFVKEAQFDRLGCFAYSPEEGTLAEKMPNQVEEQERVRRADAVMQLQNRIMIEKQEALVGQVVEAVCDEFDEESKVWRCRTKADAPEIDVNILLAQNAALKEGEFYTVRISGTDCEDLLGEYVGMVE